MRISTEIAILFVSVVVLSSASCGGGSSRSCDTDADCFADEVCADRGVCVALEGANNGTGNNRNNGTGNNGTGNNGTGNNGTGNNGTGNNGNNGNNGGGPEFVDIAAGAEFTCALESTGDLWCWGENDDERLGVAISDDVVSKPQRVVVLDGLVDVAAGNAGRCGVKEDGTLWCWGQNHGFNPGESNGKVYPEPVEMPLTDVARVEMSWWAGCALETDNRTLSCWGNTDADVPPEFTEDIVDFDLGEDHACVALTSGAVRCWGSDYFDQVGLGDPIQGISDVVELAAGKRHTCARKADGTIWCWGWNDEAQCGSMPEDFQERFDTPQQVDGIEDATSIEAGETYSCAVRDGGKLSCWGGILGMEAGHYREFDLLGPTTPFGLGKDVTLAGAGPLHTCVVKSGDVWCWGDNSARQLGEGGEKFRYEQPVKVEFPEL